MQAITLCARLIALLVGLIIAAVLMAVVANGQTINPDLHPDMNRARAARLDLQGAGLRHRGYAPDHSRFGTNKRDQESQRQSTRAPSRVTATVTLPATTPIASGTSLTRVLHAAQISLSSSAGTDEQFVDRSSDLIADERTTFDSSGGSFDIAVGLSGARYEVYSGTLSNRLVGVLVVALDTNGDFRADTSSTFDLQRDFSLPSAAAVVSGVARSGREFVVVCSSGYYNSENPGDPHNEPSPGVVLLVRDPLTGGFDTSRTRTLVTVGDNRLYNANGLALLPNNDLLIADFHSDELRIVRDTDADGLPDTLDPVPYYSYRFSDDAPLDVAANSRGVVFSHSAGDDTLMLAVYDTDHDGRGDIDEVVIEGLSIDNNLFLHGLAVDRIGIVYVIEDASGSSDDSNGGTSRIDAFPDRNLDGFLTDGSIFAEADDSVSLALSGLALGPTTANPINDASFFIRRHYLDFLSREPDSAGWAYWTDQIIMCGSNVRCVNSRRIGVSAAFFIELEFQNTGSFVYRLYKAGYGRRPTYVEFTQDRTHVGGSDVEASKRAFALTFVQRSAFVQRYANNTTASSFVDALIATIRQASNVDLTSERTTLINRYNQGTSLNESRAFAIRQAIETAVFVTAEYNPSFVVMQYFGYLNRDPEQAGYDFWLNVLNNREPNNFRGMVCAFLTSREYQERFGLMLARSNSDCSE
jgi:Domain of unknown function (DUF4214)